jgi:nucleoside-diphosphate-sugar epimerase
MLLVQGQAYREEYGFNAVYLIPTNLYGPGDSFNLESGHVIPSLVRRFSEADGEVELWGTGQATRDFLYVEDAARGIVDAMERYDGGEPTNLGTGVETSISHLAETIADLYDYQGEIVWDYSKPDGSPRRCLATERARERFHWRALMPIEVGLQRTVDWYEAHQ